MPDKDTIVKYAIYPGIGIARVGNAPEEYFVGPEAPGELPAPEGGFKDAEGRVKRQAARFRIYGLNTAGEAVKEITVADAEITWRVHLANRKAGWYEFNNAMDLPGQYAKSSLYRNPKILGAERKKLIIDPGSRTITGKNTSGTKYKFDSGKFMEKKVPLGELRTDEQGRLIVLGGYGHSASVPPKPAITFANNDGWHDDISDGPVRATLKIKDQKYEAEPAFVAVTPPNFGQGLYGVVTMYDVVYNLFCQDTKFGMNAAGRPSFWRDIYPILERLTGNQWVNSGVDFLFGGSSPSDFTSPALLKKLSSTSAKQKPLRTALFRWFRNPAQALEKQRPIRIPPFYGDAFDDFPNLGMRDLALTDTQYRWMQQWAEGDFDPDESLRPKIKPLESYPLKDQPLALDRANLESCLGGPFHPGIELTWTLRVSTMWEKPFRLNILPEGVAPKDDYGPVLTPEVALGAGGVVEASGPGTLTWWMGVPWQTDEASCLSGYEIGTYLRLPSFWAARVPNQVLSEQSYGRLMDERLSVAQRLKHFNYRLDWLRYFDPAYQKRINENVARWDKLGIITQKEGPTDLAKYGMPSQVWVETDLDPDFLKGDATWLQVEIAEGVIEVPADQEVMRFATARLEAESADIPITSRRHVLRRDEL
ncbi:MAG TPA: LodA/GoxA family CTQ-dependent oxidase [Pyrinomonadaceae bacterium]|nr:LodA/GoxA family CTQ-dependent oxidase [Pyrinomonadaceae bacterium]